MTEQVTVGDAVDAVAVAGDGEVVVVGVHVARHVAHVEEAGQRGVVLVAHLHVAVGVEAAHDSHHHGVVASGVEGALGLDRNEELGGLVEVLVDALVAQLVVAVDNGLQLLGVQAQCRP